MKNNNHEVLRTERLDCWRTLSEQPRLIALFHVKEADRKTESLRISVRTSSEVGRRLAEIEGFVRPRAVQKISSIRGGPCKGRVGQEKFYAKARLDFFREAAHNHTAPKLHAAAMSVHTARETEN